MSTSTGLWLSSKDQAILQEVCESCDADSYILTWPAGCPGIMKLKMVACCGEEGAALYHKVLDVASASEQESTCGSVWREQCVTLKQTDDNTFTVEKTERKRTQGTALGHIDWKQLAEEAVSQRRTLTPPTHLYIRGHAKWEGWKLATQAKPSRKISIAKFLTAKLVVCVYMH